MTKDNYVVIENGITRPMTEEEVKWFNDMEEIRANPNKASEKFLKKKK